MYNLLDLNPIRGNITVIIYIFFFIELIKNFDIFRHVSTENGCLERTKTYDFVEVRSG